MSILEEEALRMGQIGESIVRNELTKRDHKIFDTLDPYDCKRDFFMDNDLNCEVKTQVPWVSENSFTFQHNQVRKIRNSDIVFFVSVPHPTFRESDEYPAWIFYSNETDKLTFHTKSTESNRDMVLVSRDDKHLRKLMQIKDKEALKLLMKYRKER